ncbi:hypothetical protein BYT27DRAFT_7228555 [Phlegmacium glaucopus]|nr:hypothetical protein BYT27DRAFT_7228555 [Phlegmacium glaucopus]
MSTSPNDPQDEGADKQSLDELEDTNHVVGTDAGPSPTTPAKRGRGRPKGSKNKKATSSPAAEGSSIPTGQRKRGRPPKVSKNAIINTSFRFPSEHPHEKKEDNGETPPPKRPRGRPPKNPKPPATEGTSGEAGEPSVKKKRGRPPKKTTT